MRMSSVKMVVSWLGVVFFLAVGIGCGGGGVQSGTGGSGGGALPGTGGMGSARGGDVGSGGLACADLFNDGPPQTYSVEISDAEWQSMDAEFHNVAALMSGQDFTTYHPIVLHYGSETVSDAAIKLHGQSSWLLTVMFDANPKMQFDISFNQYNTNGKFHGVSKIVFDMPREDLTFMHDRLAHHWMRQSGIFASCTSSARLDINGSYYGLYVLEDNVNAHTVQQFFPQNPSGDLWKGGEVAQTNQSNPSWDRLMAFKSAKDLSSIAAIVDIQSSLTAWGAEALLNDGDGYYGGFHNFYLYDQGQPGYVFLPQDTDSTFDWLVQFDLVGSTDHPIYWWYKRAQPAPTPGDKWLPVLSDPTWRMRYADTIQTLLGQWDVAQIQGWIDTWWSQISALALSDPHLWTTTDVVAASPGIAKQEVAARAAYLQTFVDCEHGVAGAATDADGDGYRWCDECDDGNPNVHPGAPEVCGNMLDDNCDGYVDENCAAASAADAGGNGS
jgi:hypothetical protein